MFCFLQLKISLLPAVSSHFNELISYLYLDYYPILEHDTDSELSDLDDEQMQAFDEKLSEVFRNRKSLHAEKRDALKAMLDFKLRTIDLLEIFIKKQPSNPLILDLMLPVLDALRHVCLFTIYL